MFKRIKAIISVLFSLLKFSIIKLIRWKEFHFDICERFSPRTMINLYRGGTLILGKMVRAHTGVKISCTKGAKLSIGDNTAINYNCIIVAREMISIGINCTFGPNVVIYDHDHDYKHTEIMNGDKYISEKIVIGNNVWIGAGSIILKGTVIGDNSVIAAGSVIRGIIPENSIAYNRKEVVTKQY